MDDESASAWAPSVVLNTRWISPFLSASTTWGRPSSTLLMVATFRPAASSTRAVPRVAISENPCAASCRAGSVTRSLSPSLTEKNTVPEVGSLVPAPIWLLAKARAKLASTPITSPVERISGPSTVSTPGKRATGRVAGMHAGFLDMFHDPGDENLVVHIAERVHIHFCGAIEEAVDQHGIVARDAEQFSRTDLFLERLFIGYHHHAAPAQHIGRAQDDRIADPPGGADCFVGGHRRGIGRLFETEIVEQLLET